MSKSTDGPAQAQNSTCAAESQPAEGQEQSAMFSAVAERGSGRLEAVAEDGGIWEMRVGGEQHVVNSTRAAARRTRAETARSP